MDAIYDGLYIIRSIVEISLMFYGINALKTYMRRL